MAPSGKGGGREAQGVLGGVITKAFGSFASFREKFTSTALGVFGSGWTWLVLDSGKLVIVNTLNQDSPISRGEFPVLGLDLWEHAYYLKYQNKRADYIESWWKVVNWEEAEKRLEQASTK